MPRDKIEYIFIYLFLLVTVNICRYSFAIQKENDTNDISLNDISLDDNTNAMDIGDTKLPERRAVKRPAKYKEFFDDAK